MLLFTQQVLVFIMLMLMVFFSSLIYFSERMSCPTASDFDSLAAFLAYNEECERAAFDTSSGLCCAFWCA